tara:strand:- start:412 stop:1632 length:1221 start_codon:yes stop_codon:yes gene_type:complete
MDIDSAMAGLGVATSELLGDKRHYRKTLARCVVDTILREFPGRRFCDLSVLELGAGAGFFAAAYAECYPDESPLTNLVQTDATPRDAGVLECDVGTLVERMGGRTFDLVVSLDFLSCLAFGAGLDPDDENDAYALGQLSDALPRVLRRGGAYYDFMASVPNSQFVLRFVPDYCSRRPGRFICVLDPEPPAATSSGPFGYRGGDQEDHDEPLLFVTFGVAGLLGHEPPAEPSAAGAPPLLRVAGFDAPLSYDELRERLRLPSEPPRARAFALKVLEFLFRDVNEGGCADNWELLAYVAVDGAHFGEVFEDDGDDLLPLFQQTYHAAAAFLRAAFKGRSESYEEVAVVDAFKAVAAEHLASCAVESTQADVGGTSACYTQRYQNALVSDGDPNGEGSFRCMLTKATPR